jgi:hypothetical protein
MLYSRMMTKDNWPWHTNGENEPHNGLLNVHHAIIIFFTDKGNWARGYPPVLFEEACK